MKDRFIITLENPGGELDRRTAKTEDECRAQVLDIVFGIDYFTGGDVIRVIDRMEF